MHRDCPACGNNNYANRTFCNMRRCNQPKPGTAALLASDAGRGGLAEQPAGSWKCLACGNINWPQRTVCNKQECRQPRPSDAEMAQIEQQQQMQQMQVGGRLTNDELTEFTIF